MMTIDQLIDQMAARLEKAQVSLGHGTLTYLDEAIWLTLWALKHPIDSLDVVHELPVSADQTAIVEHLINERIRTRQPAAYLTREAWLQGIPFYVDERTIVPRSFIAELIAEAIIDPWLSSSTHHVLDLCTGNGSLAVLAAMAWPDVVVHASDLSTDALDVAQINVERHQLSNRITLHQGDGLHAVSHLEPFDLILCNPPYVNTQSMRELPLEYQAEPVLALAGGDDGMDFIRQLLEQAPEHLTPEGVLVLEIGNERDYFEQAYPDMAVIWLPTSAGSDQVVLLTRDAIVNGTQRN